MPNLDYQITSATQVNCTSSTTRVNCTNSTTQVNDYHILKAQNCTAKLEVNVAKLEVNVTTKLEVVRITATIAAPYTN